MAEVKLYNWKGEEKGTITLADSLFAVAPKVGVIHEAIVAQDANSRVMSSHVKDRSEVRGGGKKPWKQKGTGRARHGSTRSPIWVGGGVAHGPNPNQNFSKKINKKTKRTALAMLLSDRVASGAFVAVEDYSLPEAKTRYAAQMRKALPGADGSALVIITVGDSAARRATANLENTNSIYAQSLNLRDLAKYKTVIASKAAIDELTSIFAL